MLSLPRSRWVARVDIAPFAPLLGNDIRNITGRLRPDLTVSVAGQRITGTGTVDFEGGAVAMPESGLKLSGGQGRLVLQGDTLQIQRLTFQAGTGTLNGSGSMRFDAERGLVLDVGLAAQRALLVSRPDLVATISSALKITGSTSLGHRNSGPVTIDRAEISVGRRPDGLLPDPRRARNQQAGRRRRGHPADAGQEADQEAPAAAHGNADQAGDRRARARKRSSCAAAASTPR